MRMISLCYILKLIKKLVLMFPLFLSVPIPPGYSLTSLFVSLSKRLLFVFVDLLVSHGITH